MMLSTVPLNKLKLSPLNVRKTDADADIQSLADDIQARGLMQNLVVVESEPKGSFEVVAGGRRFQALQLLVQRGDMPKNHPVPVMKEERELGPETSLAENLHRVAMNPADEFTAFAEILVRYEDSGITDRAERVANCARRFGVTVRHVEQRLRLADLAPEILEALRTGKISLDAAKAYAAYPDQDLQMKVFKAEEKRQYGSKHEAATVRNAMRGKVYRETDRQVCYIGLDAYLAAGGRVVRELFMGANDADVLIDTKIVDKLSEAKAAEDADRLGKELGFAGGVVAIWNGSYEIQPKTPAGFHTSYGCDDLAEQQRREAIRFFKLAADGSGLEIVTDGEGALILNLVDLRPELRGSFRTIFAAAAADPSTFSAQETCDV